MTDCVLHNMMFHFQLISVDFQIGEINLSGILEYFPFKRYRRLKHVDHTSAEQFVISHSSANIGTIFKCLIS